MSACTVIGELGAGRRHRGQHGWEVPGDDFLAFCGGSPLHSVDYWPDSGRKEKLKNERAWINFFVRAGKMPPVLLERPSHNHGLPCLRHHLSPTSHPYPPNENAVPHHTVRNNFFK